MAKDKIHDPVKNALLNDGWTITDDPLTLNYEGTRVFVDLGAERVIAAERQGQKIAVEIKSFIGASIMNDMESALGQYTLYRSFIKRLDMDCRLYLAMSKLAYGLASENKAVQMLFDDNGVSLLIVDTITEEIDKWIQR